MKKSQKKFMNTKYRWVSLLIGISLAAASLTGCAGSSEKFYAAGNAAVKENTIEENAVERSTLERNTIEGYKTLNAVKQSTDAASEIVDISTVPAFSGIPYVAINNNVPYFVADDLALGANAFEYYSELDALGRCGVTYASICTDIMPVEGRGDIGQVKPTGWQTVKYDIVDGKYLYNRCHLIGYQLSAENANEKNLITGTRYMNVQGMLPFENMVADYVKETGNHVLYRVTPVFEGLNLVASGVLIEAESVEDQGEDILFCVYVYNVQPGIIIDYATGNSCLDTTVPLQEAIEQSAQVPVAVDYILNTNNMKFHYSTCSSVNQMSEKNKQVYSGSREDIIAMGYEPCKRCHP